MSVDPQPTADSPEYGEITCRGVVLSHVLHWVEDGDSVFRSTEFDVIASDPDPRAAVTKFVESAEDYAKFVAELARRDEATRDEAESGLALMERFARGYRSAKDELEQEHRRIINLPRRRRRQNRAGYSRSTHENSSRLQHA